LKNPCAKILAHAGVKGSEIIHAQNMYHSIYDAFGSILPKNIYDFDVALPVSELWPKRWFWKTIFDKMACKKAL